MLCYSIQLDPIKLNKIKLNLVLCSTAPFLPITYVIVITQSGSMARLTCSAVAATLDALLRSSLSAHCSTCSFVTSSAGPYLPPGLRAEIQFFFTKVEKE